MDNCNQVFVGMLRLAFTKDVIFSRCSTAKGQNLGAESGVGWD